LNHYEGQVTFSKDGVIVGEGKGTMMMADDESINGIWGNGYLKKATLKS